MKYFTNKPITHYSQLNNLHEPFAACFPTSLAMALRNNGYQFNDPTISFDDYIFELASTQLYKDLAHSILPGAKPHQLPIVMVAIANDLLSSQKIPLKAKKVDFSMAVVKQYIDSGVMLVCGTYLTGNGGHLVCICGYNNDSVILNDPYGNPNNGYKWNDGNRLDDGNLVELNKALLSKLSFLIVFDKKA